MSKMANLYRAIINEIRLVSPNGVAKKDSPIMKYLSSQYRQHATTDELLCKAKEEAKFLGETYLCYLKSVRRQAEIVKEYGGKGERSVEETAGLVGFKLPHDPK